MANPSVLNAYGGKVTGNTSVPITATAAGSLLVVAMSSLNGGTAFSAPTGFGTDVSPGTLAYSTGWYSLAPSTGTTAVAINASSTSFYVIWELSPGSYSWPASPFDVSSQSKNTSGSTSLTSNASGSTAQSIEMILGFGFANSAVETWTAGSGYTLDVNTGSTEAGEHKVTASAGAQTATFTISRSAAWACSVAAYAPSVITTSSRTVPADAALSLSSARNVPSKALFSTLNTYQRTVPSKSYLFFEGPRTVPAKAALLQTSQRVVPSQAHLLSTQSRQVPTHAALTNTAPRSVPAFASFHGVSTRQVPAQAALYLPVRTVPAYAFLTHSPSRTVPACAHFIQNGDQRFVPARALLAYDAPDAPSRLRHKKSPHGKSLHTPD